MHWNFSVNFFGKKFLLKTFVQVVEKSLSPANVLANFMADRMLLIILRIRSSDATVGALRANEKEKEEKREGKDSKRAIPFDQSIFLCKR